MRRVGCACACVALGLVAQTAQGAEIWRKSGAGDGSNQTSFNTGNAWGDGKAPSAGNVYKWTSGIFRTPDKTSGTYVFAGDRIEFGAGATIVHKTFGNAYLEFPEVVFGWSGSVKDISWTLAAELQVARIGGRFTVNTPAATPFLFGLNRGTGNVFVNDGVFVGGAGVGVALSHMYSDNMPADKTGQMRLRGDNSAYLGVWKVYNANPAKDQPGVVLVFESPTAAGGDPGAPTPNAVELSNGGGLAVTPEVCAEGPFAPVNRGVTLGEGEARFTTVSNETWSLGMPVTGAGVLRKTGAGTVRLCAACTATGNWIVEQGVLAISDGFSAPNGLPPVTVGEGADFVVEPFGAEDLTLTGLALPERIGFAGTVRDGRVGAVELDASCTLGAGPYAIRLAGEVATLPQGQSVVVARIPVSVRALSAEDFVLKTEGSELFTRDVLEFAEADGVQTVSVRRRAEVCLSEATKEKNPANGAGQWFITDAATWSDGLAPSADKDYVIQRGAYSTLRTSFESTRPIVFSGASLTLYGGNWLAHKGAHLTVSNFVLQANANVNAAGAGSSVTNQVLAGTIVLSGAAGGAAAYLYGVDAQRLWVESDIRGTGTLNVRPYKSSAVNTTELTLAGDNSAWTGKLVVDSQYQDVETLSRTMTLAFTRPEALGGSPATAQSEWIRLEHKSYLKPLASMTYETPNRCVRNAGWKAGIDVGEGIEFGLKTTLYFTGAVWKEGAGTLALGGTSVIGTPTWDATNDRVGERGILRVEEGWVKPLSTTAFEKLKLVFGEKGGLAVDAHPADAGVAEYGLFNAYVAHGADAEGSFILPEGQALEVRVDGYESFEAGTCRVPICTVPAETAAKLAGRIQVRRPLKGCRVTVETDAVTCDGATYTRFRAALGRDGCALFLR